MAHHDALTGLPNRALFEDRLTVAVSQARRSGEALAVMYLDLDRFKLVNDTLGHGAGDRLLSMVADEISGLLREGDTVARVGGDEFTLLLPQVSGSEDAIEVANRILAQLKKPKRLAGQEFRVTTSIGVTFFPGDGEDPETLLRNADTAMYRAKERGRDNYQLFTPAMNASVVQRLALERDLRRALEREEFEVYYQPFASISDGQIVGAEALVRWNHPERGLVPPDEFIPFAEETGLIIPLGEWVLTEAVCQAKAWIDEGLPPLRLAVNLSVRQLQDDPLVDMVSSILKRCGLPAERLQLEITEGAMMDSVESAIRVVNDLRHLGVGVAVDDFGTGYSSLSYLKRFPIDTVKIDRSFVRDVTIDPNDAAIVTTVLAMARSLGLHVVAEGVETRQQLEFLREHGCDEFQGYLLSRPIKADEYVKLVSAAEQARPRKSSRRVAARR
ncbi:MAG: putative bifunctional diguanylate cyclase/phosphodiesterase [Dehalococcoidia bacterium]